jgi:hypothetical protein
MSPSSRASEPLPVQPLDYSGPLPKRSDPWRQVVNAFAVAAIVYGIDMLIISARLYIRKGWREYPPPYGIPDGINLAFFAHHVLVDLTSLGFLAAGLGCVRRWSWVRRVMLASSIGVLVLILLRQLLDALFLRGEPSLWYVIDRAPHYVGWSIFPALLIWLMTRPEVREQFRHNKSPGPEASQ